MVVEVGEGLWPLFPAGGQEACFLVAEESGELLEAYREMRSMGVRTPHVRDELGDLLFAVVNVARFLDIDPEDALNSTSAKFMRRFAYIEERVADQGRKMTDMSLEQLDLLWEEAKKKLLSIYSEKNNLSRREAEVLAEVIDGRTNAEISDKLSISVSTVKKHVYNIFNKTGVSSRSQLLNFIFTSQMNQNN